MRLSWLFVLAACGESVPERDLEYDLGTCGIVNLHERDTNTLHRPAGATITWTTEPPSSGQHFERWAAWDRSYTLLDRGFWVHNLEHGGVVLLYRCDAGCPDQVAALEAAVRAMPVDPQCVEPLKHRALVASDPLLPADNMFYAVAWGVTYTATCVDPDAIAIFVRDFYGRAPEDLCAEGQSLGGLPIE